MFLNPFYFILTYSMENHNALVSHNDQLLKTQRLEIKYVFSLETIQRCLVSQTFVTRRRQTSVTTRRRRRQGQKRIRLSWARMLNEQASVVCVSKGWTQVWPSAMLTCFSFLYESQFDWVLWEEMVQFHLPNMFQICFTLQIVEKGQEEIIYNSK